VQPRAARHSAVSYPERVRSRCVVLALIPIAACTPRGGELPQPREREVTEPAEPPADPPAPAATPITGLTAIAPGVHHTCALESGRVLCWGHNPFDTLGVGPGLPDPVLEPRPVIGLDDVGPIVQLASDYDFSCVLTESGEVYCWGANDHGQLGVGDLDRRDRPSKVLDVRASAIYLGFRQGCAIAFDRSTAWCWGSGEFGDGQQRNFENRAVEIAALANVDQLAIPEGGCWLRQGAMRCWGSNASGRIGNGEGGCEYDEPLCNDCKRLPSQTCKHVDKPTAPLGLPEIMQIAASGSYTYALDRSGGVWQWGQTGHTMSFEPYPNYRPDPVAEIPVVTQISAGASHVCALDLDGEIWCWGNDSFGQLGFENTDRHSSQHPSPHLVKGLPRARVVAAGFYFTCALTGEGERTQAWCWGDNGTGQLGDGTTERRHAPTLVRDR
jgi:alpha-tubulin suppressor-like RCC1 family protein